MENCKYWHYDHLFLYVLRAVDAASLRKAKVPVDAPPLLHSPPLHFPSVFKRGLDGSTQEIPSFLLLCSLLPGASVIDIKTVLFDQ